MKNFATKILLGAFALILIQACGPTEEEKRAREQARMDSLLKVQQQEIAEAMAALEADSANNSMDEEASEMTEDNTSTSSDGYTFAEDGQYAVQVGAFRSEEKAKAYLAKWADRSYPNAYTVKIGEEATGDVWFRVRVGFFSTKEDAAELGAVLAEEMNSGYWVSKVR
ncbi:SPOR domain-containing protein [Balneola vulgaris]|jgi:cell division septation protein DedD|uniref:SPOR domain-containing protein n=1 Tax=Balneola vulgaris TaxID=287535 RepID=UPI00036F194B|nr:SPOR domain-containing protein [Balneola vulgaris]